jgi:hypothetical protein
MRIPRAAALVILLLLTLPLLDALFRSGYALTY